MRIYLVSYDGYYIAYNTVIKEGINLPTSFDINRLVNVVFDDITGRIYSYNQYMPLFDSKTNEFKGYFPIEDFFSKSYFKNKQYLSNSITDDDSRYLRVFDGLGDKSNYGVQPNYKEDKIFLVKRVIESIGDNYIYKIKVKSFNFPNIDFNFLGRINFDNIDQSFLENYHNWSDDNYNSQFSSNEYTQPFNLPILSRYAKRIIDKKFKVNGILVDLNQSYIDVVEDISKIFDLVFQNQVFVDFINSSNINLKFIFDKHFEIIDNNSTNTVISELVYYKYFNGPYFQKLRIRLLEFYYWVKSLFFEDNILLNFLVSRTDLLRRIYGLFDQETLQFFEYETKKQLIKSVLVQNGFLTGFWLPTIDKYVLTEEELIIKIINSVLKLNGQGNIIYDDINLFMDLLLSKEFYTNSDGYSLYEVLYDKIDPDVIFGGAGAQGQFVDTVYQLWLNSKYNPKSVIVGVVNYSYLYTENNALIYDLENDDYIVDNSAAPRILPYKSQKNMLWFDNNFKFVFRKNRIIAAIENSLSGCPFVTALQYLYENLADEEVPGYTPYGNYHIFQPINVINVGDTFVEVPFDTSMLPNNGENFDPCTFEAEGRGSNLPIFYLKYIDDIASRKNTEETVMLAIDIISVIAGGWGIYRRLIAEGAQILIRKAFTTTLSEAEKILLKKTLKSVIRTNALSALELLFGSLSIFNNIVSGNCLQYNDCNNIAPTEGSPQFEAYLRCQAIQKWLFALEILTLSGDVIAQNFFKKSTKELNQILPENNPFPNITNSQYSQIKTLLNSLDEIDEILSEFIQNLPTDIANKINTFTDSNKKFAFMFDFQNRADDLLTLSQDSAVAVDRWSNLFDLKAIDRSVIDVITNPDRVTSITRYYQNNDFLDILEGFTYEKRWMFLDEMGDVSTTNFNRFVNDSTLITNWIRYYDNTILRSTFKALGETKMISFLEDYGNAATTVFNKFKSNKMLIKHWDECHIDFLAYRTEIKFLEELHHFKVKDPNAFDHLAFFKSRPKSGFVNTKFNCTGGHTEIIDFTGLSAHKIMSNNIKVLDPLFVHNINTSNTSQRMIDYLNNTLNNTNVGLGKKYSKTPTTNGHFEHRDILFKVDPQPSSLSPDWANQWVLNGELYQFKRLHTQYNPLWTEQKIVHDMALASKNKTLVSTQSKASSLQVHGQTREWIETTYKSTLLDGSDITIKHVNHHRYNLQTPFDDHFSYFEID